jgi:prophage antirepressor-like protein
MRLLPLRWNATGKAEPFLYSAKQTKFICMHSTVKSSLNGKNIPKSDRSAHDTVKNQSIQIFENPEFGKVRTILSENGEPLFCLLDVCKILDLQTNKVKQRLNSKGWYNIPFLTAGGKQLMIFIDEPNLYRCVFQSRKQEAEQFQDWVYEGILPSIRKSGGYSIPQPVPTPTPIPRYSPFIELAKQCPDVNITLKAGELIEAIDYCVNRTRKELEQLITDANTETYPSIEQVSKILDVNKTTLWRWQKQGYLIPIEVGGKRRYKMSDINKILNKG